MNFELWIETELGDPSQEGNRTRENFCNVAIKLPDGRRYALNVWTFDFLPLARLPWPHDGSQTGELANYLVSPDLFVTSLERPQLEQIVSELIEQGQLKEEWLCSED